MELGISIYFLVIQATLLPPSTSDTIDIIQPSECEQDSFYDISHLKCAKCPVSTVKSSDGYFCSCKPGFKKKKDYGGIALECEECPEGEVASPDGWSCQGCASGVSPAKSSCAACTVAGQFQNWIGTAGYIEPEQKCSDCQPRSAPAPSGDFCTPCNPTLRGVDCQCKEGTFIGGTCFNPKTEDFKPADDVESMYRVQFKQGAVDSAYNREHVRAIFPLCKKGNLTACQVLGNLCVLLQYTRDQNQGTNACTLFIQLAGLGGQEVDWPKNMPWLWYLNRGGSGYQELNGPHIIETSFTFEPGKINSKLRIKAAQYSLDGEFIGITDVTGGTLQLCKNEQWIMDAAFTFGRKYHQKCNIPIQQFWTSYPLTFMDLYLEYEDEKETGPNKKKWYAIPVRNLNIPENLNDEEPSRWQLTRRIFLVDNVAGRSAAKGFNSNATRVRYPAFIQLNIRLKQTKDGHIFPPYLTIKYDEVSLDRYEENPRVPVEFNVDYSMETARHDKDIEITMGVLCSIGALWTGVKAMSWSRRAGKMMLDFPTVAKFLLYMAGTISDVFFIVMLGTSLWILIAYKEQLTVVYMVLTPKQEFSFLVYLGLAAGLKLVEMVHLIIEQVSSETFFIDWERPRGHVIPNEGRVLTREDTGRSLEGGEGSEPGAEGPNSPVTEPPRSTATKAAGYEDYPDSPITIWRTYLIANEWNELSSYRKTSYVLQLFFMVFLLEVLNFKNLALIEPGAHLGDAPKEYQDSRMFRFALAAGLYLLFGFFQWFVNVFIVERCIVNHFGSFVDLCSISNISVLCLTRPQFGFYIHGRSVHGHADTNMREMNEMLQRERENLRGTRGLKPDSDIQCFMVCLPNSFREHFESILTPLRGQHISGNRLSGHDLVTAKTEQTISVYTKMTQFLCNFMEKQGEGNSYEIRDRTFFECLLDMEFGDPSQTGIFFSDPSETGFSNAFLYGQEWTQLTFDLLLFCIVDLLTHNFILAACVSYLVISFLRFFRESGGTSRLVRTSLVDGRFLI